MPDATADPELPDPLPTKPELFTECDMEAPITQSFAGGTVCFYTRRCPEKETPNEDSMAVIPVGKDSGVLVVADGLGGIRGGHLASAAAVEAIRDRISESSPVPGDLRTAILDGIEAANQRILDMGLGSATTLSVVEFSGNTVRPYHVGDSMILLVGQKGRIKLETMPHSPVGHALQAGMIDEEEAMQHADRHIVTNCVGQNDMRIEIGSPVEMAIRDTLLLASDGLCDNLTVPEIIQTVRSGNLADRSQTLISAARAQMQLHAAPETPSKPDDLTVIVFRRTEQD
ncbi:MAG: protein phosphatase 2C domain-containing protein [Fuerstiella sp.]